MHLGIFKEVLEDIFIMGLNIHLINVISNII